MRFRALAGPLEEPQFRNFFFARGFSMLGDAIVPVALAFAVLDIERSASALGLVLAAYTVPRVVLIMFAGVWADRLPRNQLMVATDLLRFASQATAALLLISGAAEIWHLIALNLVSGVGASFFVPASTGLVPQIVSPGRLQEANGLLSLTGSSFDVLGPVLGGVFVATVGSGWAFAADAATFLVSAVFLTRLALPPRIPRVAETFLRELRAGWREFTSRGWLWVDGLFSALANMTVLAPVWALGPLVAEESLDGATSWAAIVTCFGLGSVIAGAAVIRFKPERPVFAGVVVLSLLALPPALLAVPAPTPVIAAGAFLAGFGLIFFNTLFETTVQEQVPSEALSRVAAIDWMLSLALYPVGLALAGFVAEAIGTGPTLAIAAAWSVVSTVAVLMVPSVREVRRRPATIAAP
ncbi:MAG TPA: MFS transporter [Gaiellaceae bacterium]|nr:MFS transporter [Gaiellaceae bacterium]